MMPHYLVKHAVTLLAATAFLFALSISSGYADDVEDTGHWKTDEHANREGFVFVEPGIHNLGYTRDGNMLIAIDDQAEVDALYPGCRRMAVGADAHRQFCKKPVRPLTPATAQAWATHFRGRGAPRAGP